MLGIRHIYCASRHPQTQGNLERFCETLKARLNLLVYIRALTQREPHWNVTDLVPSELVTRLDVIGCEPYFRQ